MGFHYNADFFLVIYKRILRPEWTVGHSIRLLTNSPITMLSSIGEEVCNKIKLFQKLDRVIFEESNSIHLKLHAQLQETYFLIAWKYMAWKRTGISLGINGVNELILCKQFVKESCINKLFLKVIIFMCHSTGSLIDILIQW